jgi:hypothetical protein
MPKKSQINKLYNDLHVGHAMADSNSEQVGF